MINHCDTWRMFLPIELLPWTPDPDPA